MAAVTHHDEDTDTSSVERRDLGGYTVRLVVPTEPFMSRSVIGWGKAYNRAVNEMRKADDQRQIETCFLVFSYHTVSSGRDAWDFKSRVVLPGVTLLGEGDVIAWQGSVLDGGVRVVAPMSKPPTVPEWLANAIGKPRSRKAMSAAREAAEAITRRDNAHVAAAIAARRAYEEQEREQADKDRERAERVLAEVMAKDS